MGMKSNWLICKGSSGKVGLREQVVAQEERWRCCEGSGREGWCRKHRDRDEESLGWACHSGRC